MKAIQSNNYAKNSRYEYEIIIVGAVRRQLKRISREDKKRILDKIQSPVANPRPHGFIELKGSENLFRVRVGDYRIVYEIQDKILLITVLKVGNRREIYR